MDENPTAAFEAERPRLVGLATKPDLFGDPGRGVGTQCARRFAGGGQARASPELI